MNQQDTTQASQRVGGGVVIVGGGLAGVQTATLLRQRGWTGPITMLAAEDEPPYDRPPLSKAILLGQSDSSPLPFDPEALDVDLRLGTPVRGLGDGVVRTDRGPVAYEALVIATGAVPVRLPGAGGRYLRTRADALALRSALRPGARIVICGAGWIGAEVATAARKAGTQVTVVEQGATPVARALPAPIGEQLARWYAEAGVDLRTHTGVVQVDPGAVTLDDGVVLEAEEVLVGVGVRPACDWLEGTGLTGRLGVEVGADLRSRLPGVYAVGDVAARWSPRYEARLHGEHWDDALRGPSTVVAGLLGEEAAYDPVPYVWSEQFGRMAQYAGPPDRTLLERSRLLWRGDPGSEPRWTALWLDADDHVVAVFAVDRPRDFVQARRAADRRTLIDPDQIGDPGIAVRDAVAGSVA